jgi:hypothetical protein
MENINNFINSIAAGDNVTAKEELEELLSSKAFDALQYRKQEIASTLFGGQQEEEQDEYSDEEIESEE